MTATMILRAWNHETKSNSTIARRRSSSDKSACATLLDDPNLLEKFLSSLREIQLSPSSRKLASLLVVAIAVQSFVGLESSSIVAWMENISTGLAGILATQFFLCSMFGIPPFGSLVLCGIVAKFLLKFCVPVSSAFAISLCLVDGSMSPEQCIGNSIIVSTTSYLASIFVGCLVQSQLRRPAGP